VDIPVLAGLKAAGWRAGLVLFARPRFKIPLKG
jgi:hypothetical protein